MKFFIILKKELKQQMRDKQGLVLMILFPMVLTLVLGFSLSGMFNSDASPSQVSSLYFIDSDSQLAKAFEENLLPESKEMNLIFTEEKDLGKGKEAVKTGSTTSFVHITDEGITIYAREGSTFRASLVETVLKGFAQTYDAYLAVARIEPAAMQKLTQVDLSQSVYTSSVSLDRGSKPRAMDYYAITMLTLIMMYASMSGISTITEERRDKTLFRIFGAPVRNSQILVAKVTGTVIATILQALILFIFDSVFLKVQWGSNLLPIFIIILAQIIMMVSVGVGSAYLFKNPTSGMSLLQSLIPILVFLGGGYVNLELLGVGGLLEKITYISPVRWINKTLLQIIYANDYSTFGTTIMICLIIAVVFLSLSAVLSRKELKV